MYYFMPTRMGDFIIFEATYFTLYANVPLPRGPMCKGEVPMSFLKQTY